MTPASYGFPIHCHCFFSLIVDNSVALISVKDVTLDLAFQVSICESGGCETAKQLGVLPDMKVLVCITIAMVPFKSASFLQILSISSISRDIFFSAYRLVGTNPKNTFRIKSCQ